MRALIRWADIVGYEDLYQISDTGLVKAKHKVIHRKLVGSTVRPARIITPKKRGQYLAVQLYNANHKSKFHSIHRLVASQFCTGSGDCVNHKDEDKHNNNHSNLEWCTASYNQRYSKGKKLLMMKDGTTRLFNSFPEAIECTGLSEATLYRMYKDHNRTSKGWRIIQSNA